MSDSFFGDEYWGRGANKKTELCRSMLLSKYNPQLRWKFDYLSKIARNVSCLFQLIVVSLHRFPFFLSYNKISTRKYELVIKPLLQGIDIKLPEMNKM